MKKEKHICEGKNKTIGYVGIFLDYTYGSSRSNCDKNATIFENGKWYCKRHAPSKIQEREDKSWATYVAKINSSKKDNI